MEFLRDVRLALGAFARRPVLALGMTATLAVGLGAATAIFTVLAAGLWGRFPAEDAERLYHVRPGTREQLGWELSNEEWLAYREAWADIGRIEGRAGFSVVVGLPGPGEAVTTAYGFGAAVSDGFFRLLPVRGPLRGRLFTAAEHGSNGPPVAVLDHGFWQRHLGGDPAVVGRALLLNGQPFTIVGITPLGYQAAGWVYQLCIPLERLDDVSTPPLPIRPAP